MSNGLLKSVTSLTSHAKISQVSQEIGWIFGELDALPSVALKRAEPILQDVFTSRLRYYCNVVQAWRSQKKESRMARYG